MAISHSVPTTAIRALTRVAAVVCIGLVAGLGVASPLKPRAVDRPV